MDATDLELELKERLKDKILQSTLLHGQLTLQVEPAHLRLVVNTLMDNTRCQFRQLVDICGVDYPGRPLRFDVVYHLLSHRFNTRIRLKVSVAEGQSVPSLMEIFPAACWWEREAWDMYGIPFEGNANLRRILTDYGFEGHPLRKDFPLTGFTEVRYDEAQKRVVYEPVKLTQDFRTFEFLSPWEGLTPQNVWPDSTAAPTTPQEPPKPEKPHA